MCHSGSGRGESMRKEDEVKRNANCKMCSTPIFISHIMKSPIPFTSTYTLLFSAFSNADTVLFFLALGPRENKKPFELVLLHNNCYCGTVVAQKY